MYCSGLFVNIVLCDTLPAPGEPGLWDSSEELFTVVASQYHGKGKVCFEGALQLKGECVAPLPPPELAESLNMIEGPALDTEPSS